MNQKLSSLRNKLNHLHTQIEETLHDFQARQPLLPGSLYTLKRRCGKPNCRCARGEPHVSLYVVQSHGGKPRQVFVPKPWEERIRAAVEDYQQLQLLIEEFSELEWRRLMERQE